MYDANFEDDDLPVAPISKHNSTALDNYAPLHEEEYRGFKQDFLAWLLTEGHRPVKGEGYAENTVKQTHYKVEEAYRWVWNQEGFTTTLTPAHADSFVTEQIKHYSDDLLLDFIKSLKRLFKFLNNTTGESYDWEYENKSEITMDTSGTKSIDYFKRHEMHALYDAAVKISSMKSYHAKSMTPKERDGLRTHLAQRYGTPKEKIGPDEFKRANSWKLPSVVALCIDTGLRPIEVAKANLRWVNLQDRELVIPRDESTKNDEPWVCTFSKKTARTLSNWLEEREQYEKYVGTDKLWLTRYDNPYGTNSLNPLLQKMLDETDITPNGRDLTWYSFRRGCATMWANKADIQDAKAQLRHSKVETTLRYVHSSSKRRSEIADSMW